MFSIERRIWSFHVVALQRTAKKCTKSYNARVQLLFCSLNLLFSDVAVVVAVVVFLNSLITSDLLQTAQCCEDVLQSKQRETLLTQVPQGSTTTSATTETLKQVFSEYGLPQTVMTDNGPPFSSKEFAAFTNQYRFDHITSSPCYPQSNGFIECMVQTVKRVIPSVITTADVTNHYTPDVTSAIFYRWRQ